MHIREMIAYLKQEGFTESAIAHGSQLSQSTISRLLSGKIKDPKFSVVERIRTLFHEHRKNAVSIS